MVFIAKRVDTLFGTRFLFIATRTTKGRIKAIFVQRLLQALGFHDVGVLRGAVIKWVDPRRQTFWIFMHDEIKAVLFGRRITKRNHVAKLPVGIDVQQRKRDLAG